MMTFLCNTHDTKRDCIIPSFPSRFGDREKKKTKMGKTIKQRQKFHIKAEKKDATIPEKKEKIKYKPLPFENIFAGINIPLDSINKLEDTPELSLSKVRDGESILIRDANNAQGVTAVEPTLQKINNMPGKHLRKKDKMTLKHQKFMGKLDVAHKAKLLHQNEKQNRNPNLAEQMSESSLQSAPVKSTNQLAEKVQKNICSSPSLNDNLPALNLFEIKLNQNCNRAYQINVKSKTIAKNENSKTNFVENYTFLAKAMAKKNKK